MEKLYNSKKLVKEFLTKTFDIRAGEFKRAFLMMLYIFLVISSNLILKPTVISLFLSEFGVDQLPIVFIFVAVFAAVGIAIYSHSLKTTSINLIIVRTFLYSNLSFFLFWILIEVNFLNGWALYLFYIWVAIFSVLSASQFWIFANLIFNTREAKRLFGFIGAGAIAGGIFGGYLTSILAGIIGSENLILISIAMLSGCIPIVNYLWKNNVLNYQSHVKQMKSTKVFTDHPIKMIKSSRHLTYLASIVAISVIVARLVEFQFSAIASSEILNEDELTSFFGFWFSNMNIISLIIQLFLTRRVVGVFGVGSSLFFLPAGIFIGTFAVFISPHLWAAILLRISDGSLKQSINKSSMELLALPVPVEIKKQTKSYIDIFVDSFATGVGGVILLVLSSGFNISIRYISLGTIILLIGWLYIVFQVRKEYLNSFKLKLENNKDSIDKKKYDLNNESVLGGIIKILTTGTEKHIIQTLNVIKEVQNDKLLPTLESLINHPSSKVQLEVLRNLYFYKSHNYKKEVELLINDPDEEVRIAAFHYLFEHAPEDSLNLMNKYINHPDTKINSSALVSLAAEVKDNSYLKDQFNLDKIIDEKLNRLKKKSISDTLELEKITTVRVISIASLTEKYSEINNFLQDSSVRVVNAAIESIGHILLREFIPVLIEKLDSPETARAAILTLRMYGDTAIFKLSKKFNDPQTDKQTKKNILEVIETNGSKDSVNLLFSALEKEDYWLQKDILKTLNNLKKNFPMLKFDWDRIVHKLYDEVKLELEIISSLYLQTHIEEKEEVEGYQTEKGKKIFTARKNLISLLEKRMDSGLERIFRLLGLKYPPDDMIEILNSIQSSKEDLRSNAVDFLDNLLDVNLKKLIIPLIEITISEKISKEILAQYKLKIPKETDSFEELLYSKDNQLVLATIRLVVLTEKKELLPIIEKIKEESPNKKIIEKTLADLR
jgi:AAA family ATP:ADP antiporter